VVLDYKKSLYEASRPIEHVYFPIDGVASMVITTADGLSAEVGTIGSEGIVGFADLSRRLPSAFNGYVQFRARRSGSTRGFSAKNSNEARH